jgi:hypothetical protein
MAYSDGEQAEALIRLAINQYDYDLTAEQTGISARTLRRFDKSATKNSVAELLERAIQRMLMAIPEKMDAKDWAVALGILMDKWLLIQGEPTSRVESIERRLGELPASELDSVIAEAERIIAAATGGDAHP